MWHLNFNILTLYCNIVILTICDIAGFAFTALTYLRLGMKEECEGLASFFWQTNILIKNFLRKYHVAKVLTANVHKYLTNWCLKCPLQKFQSFEDYDYKYDLFQLMTLKILRWTVPGQVKHWQMFNGIFRFAPTFLTWIEFWSSGRECYYLASLSMLRHQRGTLYRQERKWFNASKVPNQHFKFSSMKKINFVTSLEPKLGSQIMQVSL